MEESVEQDDFITQILNENEMEKFKEKFASPNIQSGNNSIHIEEDDEDIFQTKKKRKRLLFSDDESDDEPAAAEEEEEEEEETIGLCDVDDESNVVAEEADDVRYDSEENEIEMDTKPSGLKLNDFFEDEAELSESEWGSEDEDERGLDALDEEKGDEENFDENELRSDLERIHMLVNLRKMFACFNYICLGGVFWMRTTEK